MKKLSYLGALALVALSMLAGCGGSSDGPIIVPPEPTELVWDQGNWDQLDWQ